MVNSKLCPDCKLCSFSISEYCFNSRACSPIATAHRGLGSDLVLMTPYGRFSMVKGNVSKDGDAMMVDDELL